MIEHETGGRLFDAKVFTKGLDSLDPRSLFFIGDLTRDVPDQIGWKVKPFYNMLSGVGLPGDGELDVASDLAVTVASGAVDFALGATFIAVLLPVAVFRMLAVEAPKVSMDVT